MIEHDKPIAVEEKDLPLVLPDMVDFQPGDDPQGCLARAVDWRYFSREVNGKTQWYARETNTMPQWAGSCWYYLRFADPKAQGGPLTAKADQDWLPVDLYVGGQEHAVLHLLYARFWHRVLYDAGVTKCKEPFMKLVHQGMILGSDGEKMSKSRGNVVNPDDVTAVHGADALRLYEMFMGPLEAKKPWQTSQVAGVVRFRDKVYGLAKRVESIRAKVGAGEPNMDKETAVLLHKTMRKVSMDLEAMSLNTPISALMVLCNHLSSLDDAVLAGATEAVEKLVLMVSPYAPHVAEESWRMLGHGKTLTYEGWVEYDEDMCKDETVTIGVQVNGKVKSQLTLAVDEKEYKALELAMADPKVAKACDGKKIAKCIYRAGKILNLVLAK